MFCYIASNNKAIVSENPLIVLKPYEIQYKKIELSLLYREYISISAKILWLNDKKTKTIDLGE